MLTDHKTTNVNIMYRASVTRLIMPYMSFWPSLGVVHNCQHLPISTQSTNLGGGRGAEAS